MIGNDKYITKPTQCECSHIEILSSLMNLTRSKTLALISNLSINQLDYFFDEKSNSIGILLKHIAALEKIAQLLVFRNRRMTTAELKEWHGSLPGELNLKQIHSQDILYYKNIMKKVRSQTLSLLKKKDDDWLFSETIIKGIQPKEKVTNYYILFHCMEDEISHQGQIKLIKRRLPEPL